MLPAALLFIGSILFIGAGIFCIVQPAASLLAVGYYVGFVLVLGGVCQILRYVKTGRPVPLPVASSHCHP